jgi:DNA-damage-inducible protein J
MVAQLNFRIDDSLKEESSEFFESIEMDLSTGIKIYLHTVVREQKIPFDFSSPQDDYSRSVREYEQGDFETVESTEELMSLLDNED